MVTNSGLAYALAIITGKRQSKPLTLRLYRNDHTPRVRDQVSDYTEVDIDGYEPEDLMASRWALDGNEAVYPKQKLMQFQGQEVFAHGWYLTTADGALLAADRFADAPWHVRVWGDAIEVAPVIELGVRE